MNLLVKRSAVYACAALILFSSATGAVFGGIARAASAVSAPVAVIAAGHGALDSGLRGIACGRKECDINLS